MTSIVCHFHTRGRFLGDISQTSVENSILEPPNLKIFWGRIPPDPPHKVRTFGNHDNAPLHYKNTSYGPAACSILDRSGLKARTKYTLEHIFQLTLIQKLFGPQTKMQVKTVWWLNTRLSNYLKKLYHNGLMESASKPQNGSY